MKNTHTTKENPLHLIIKKFDVELAVSVSPYGNGRIHKTFLVETGFRKNREYYILQKLHPIIKPSVIYDIEMITTYLERKGMRTPRLIKTKEGKLYFARKNTYWRMLTYIPGLSYEKEVTKKRAQKGAALLGRIHHVLHNFSYQFKHRIPYFHDTPKIMKRLKTVLKAYRNTKKYNVLHPIAKTLLEEYKKITLPSDLPNRIIHGDPKLSNIRYNKRGSAIAMLDLDTFGRNKIIVDIGDMIRSWCNRSGEDAKNPLFNLKNFDAIMKGYAKEAHFLTHQEKKSISSGIALITLELAARFLIDAFEEKYFTLDSVRYKTLYHQNMAKAQNQLVFYNDFLKKKEKVSKILKRYYN